jgi:DNA-binding phage protein
MTHECAMHEAGSAQCYTDHRCRCAACSAAGNAYRKRQRAGVTSKVPTSVVCAHLDLLATAGMSALDIAADAGVSRTTITRILTGETSSVWRRTARVLLAVQPRPGAYGTVSAVGTARRMQALAALGWSSRAIAIATGIPDSNVRRIRRHAIPTVSATTAAAVRSLYDHASMRPPTCPDLRLLNLARRNGWAPPLAWDDDLGPHGIDNPDATPCLPGDSQTDRLADALWLIDAGESPSRIAARVGYKDRDGLYQALNRAGLGDQVQRLSKAQRAEYDALRDAGLGEIRGPRKVA